jgi:hypothetical protein
MLEPEASICKCFDSTDMWKCITESKKPKVILQIDSDVFIPHSIQTTAKEIDFNTDQIFPRLHKSVIDGCGVETYDAIYDYCLTLNSDYFQLTKRQTEELVVKALFSFDLNRLTFGSALAIFFIIYQKNYSLPAELMESIRRSGDKEAQTIGITLLSKIPSSEEVAICLATQWKLFLEDDNNAEINFNDTSMATFLPIMFSSSALARHKICEISQLTSYVNRFSNSPWLMTALDFSFFDKKAVDSFLSAHIETVRQMISDTVTTPSAEKWLEVAQQWGQVRYLEYKSGTNPNTSISALSLQLEKAFRDFFCRRYDQIVIGSTSSNPISVNEIMPNIASIMEKTSKIALLVFDGMGIDQWEILKKYFDSNSLKIKSERFAYTMLPSLTGYSRQAILSGTTPNEFSKFLSTSDERNLFQNFWVANSVPADETIYLHLNPDPNALSKPCDSMLDLLTAIEQEKRVLAVIFTFIDKRLHESSELDVGKKLLYSKIENFLESSCLALVIKKLKENGYSVFLTSDHGNVAATGNGINDSKHMVEIHGKRCLVYDSITLASEKQKQADVILFESRFIPEKQYVLFPNGNFFFGPDGAKEITHGGVSIEEVVVPYVEVEI